MEDVLHAQFQKFFKVQQTFGKILCVINIGPIRFITWCGIDLFFRIKKIMILLGSLNLVFMCGLNFLFLTFLFNFLLKMMKKKLLRTISVTAAHVFKRPFVLPKSVLNLIFPRLNCCKIRNICLYVIFIVSSMYRCTSHAFLVLSGGELQQLFMSVHLAH